MSRREPQQRERAPAQRHRHRRDTERRRLGQRSRPPGPAVVRPRAGPQRRQLQAGISHDEIMPERGPGRKGQMSRAPGTSACPWTWPCGPRGFSEPDHALGHDELCGPALMSRTRWSGPGAEYRRQRIGLVRYSVDPAITGELPEERAAAGLSRTGRVRPVIAGRRAVAGPGQDTGPGKPGPGSRTRAGGKRGGTAVHPCGSGRVVLVE